MNKSIDLIMIIDDHDISNFMAQQVIINSGISKRTIIQPAGFSALNYLVKHQANIEEIPQVIFLDLDMPVVDGLNFLKQFQQLPPLVTGRCKIVILSGFNKKESIQPWIDKGVVAFYMYKPLTPSEIEIFRNSEVFKRLLGNII